jgi:hypothetical protein
MSAMNGSGKPEDILNVFGIQVVVCPDIPAGCSGFLVSQTDFCLVPKLVLDRFPRRKHGRGGRRKRARRKST